MHRASLSGGAYASPPLAVTAMSSQHHNQHSHAHTHSWAARNSPPSSADWERLKPTIIRLYESENRPLKEVRQIIEQRFGLKAR